MFKTPLLEFIPFLAGLLNAAVALVAWRKEAAFKLNRRFGLLCLAMAVWNLGSFVEEYFGLTPEARLFFSRISHLGGAAAGPLGLHFILRFTRRPGLFWSRLLGLSYAVSAVVALLLFTTPLVIRGIGVYAYGHHAIWGPVYPLHIFNLILDYSLMLVLLGLSLRESVSNVERNRTLYIFTGTLIVVLTTLSNFFPAMGIKVWAPGHLGTLAFMILVLVAIYRYRLMNVRLALAKYLLLFLFWLLMGLAYSLILWTLKHGYPAEAFAHHALLFNFLAAGLFVLLFQAGLSRLLPRIEKMVYPLKADVRALLSDLDARLAKAAGARAAAAELLSLSFNAVKVPSAAVYVRENPDIPILTLAGVRGQPENGLPEKLDRSTPLARLRVVAVREELKRDIEIEQFRTVSPSESRALLAELDRLSLEAMVPIAANEEQYGFLGFSRKRLGGVYDREDLDALRVLATRAAVAMANFETSEKLRSREHLALMGEMTASIAHELKNPLGVIAGAAEKLPPGAYTGMIREETARLDAIVRSFLSFVKPQDARTESVDLGRLLTRCRELFLSESLAKDFIIRLPETGAPVAAELDPDLFKQIFYNLARNSLEAKSDGALTVASEVSEHELRLVFTDNCGGIAPASLGRIFQPFFTTKASGTGLGMAIVKKLVESMRGNIYITSQEGIGTEVRLAFPRRKEKTA